MNIRHERPQDIEIIHAVEAAAFGRDVEADLVNRLRENEGITLSLVAEQDDQIVGHILFSPMTIDGVQDTVLALGPVGVLPDYQKQGIGAALIREGLRQAAEMGYTLVFLVGHPTYYPRLGFRQAVPLGFDSVYTPDKTQHEHFMVYELVEGALHNRSGFVRFRPEFDGL